MIQKMCSAVIALVIVCQSAVAQDLIWDFQSQSTFANANIAHDPYGGSGPAEGDWDAVGPTGFSQAAAQASLSTTRGTGTIETLADSFTALGGDGSTLYSVGGTLDIGNVNTSVPYADYCLADAGTSSSTVMRLDSLSSATGTRTVYGDLDFVYGGNGTVMPWINQMSLSCEFYRNGVHLGTLIVGAGNTNGNDITWVPNNGGSSVRVVSTYGGTNAAFSGHSSIEIDLDIGNELKVVTSAYHSTEFASTPDDGGVSGGTWSLAVSTTPFGP